MFVREDCSETCTCVNTELQCRSLECSKFAECGVRAGMRGCVCREGFEGNGLICKEGK